MTDQQGDIKTRKMRESDLPLVLSWRNHPDVRQYMYTRHIITPDEHRQWFANACDDDNKVLLIFEMNEHPLGFIQFKQAKDTKSADWGFYLAPDASKGTGQLLGKTALNYAFVTRQWHTVYAEAIGSNTRSIRFHLSLGFEQTAITEKAFFDGDKHQDIHHFQLNKANWTNTDRTIDNEKT